MRGLLLLISASALGLGSGCANARFVHKAGDEGIIAVADRSDSWPSYNMSNAKKMIESHVGPYYDIIEEREVVTGNVTTNMMNTNRNTAVNPVVPFLQSEQQLTTNTSTTEPVKEWQIHYRRRNGTPVGTGFGGPGPLGGLQQTGGGAMPVQQQFPGQGTVAGPQFELPSVMPAGVPNPGPNLGSPAAPSSVSPAALSAGSTGGYQASSLPPMTGGYPGSGGVQPASYSPAGPQPNAYPASGYPPASTSRPPTITVTGN